MGSDCSGTSQISTMMPTHWPPTWHALRLWVFRYTSPSSMFSRPVNSVGRATAEDRLRQANVYRRVVRACLRNPGCTAIQTWGFTDEYSWIGRHSHGARGAA